MKFSTKTLVTASLLVAIAIVLQNVAITTSFFRFSFFEFPLILLGFLFGPVMGLIAGFVTDFIYVMINPWAFSFNLMTISTMMIGFIAGISFIKTRKPKNTYVFGTVVLIGLVTFILNTVQLYLWKGNAIWADFPLRLIIMIIKWPIYTYLFTKIKVFK